MTTAVLSHSLFILTLVGLWRPIDWRGWKSLLYNSYTYFVAFANFVFILTEFVDIVTNSSSVNDLTNGLTKIMGQLGAFGKVVGIMLNRKMILQGIKLLELKPFKLEDQDEKNVLKKYISISNYITFFYLAVFTIGASGILFSQMSVMDFPNVLPYRAWFPYNYSKPILFQTTAAFQLITFFNGAYVHVAFDTLFLRMMLCVVFQISVLEHRLEIIISSMKKLVKNNNMNLSTDEVYICDMLIEEWVNHHNAILKFSQNMYENFSGSIFLQYCLSSTQICVCVYTISNVPFLSGVFMSEMVLLIGTIMQIFLLCISAHQVTLKFDDLNYSVYCIEWFYLNTYLQKSISIIISKTMKPVVFKSGYFVTLSLESLKHVMKLSYSIYNLLQ
ncbi:putative odorant receptor 71a [Cotesia glomerata]|uniref:putative odorant receptor 71a n=1 Tax=Cotesia glomerata TaxID=32391 RepID=UPI001D024EE7|nr:putative odorant receptor 71a [Cotesia glomerata]